MKRLITILAVRFVIAAAALTFAALGITAPALASGPPVPQHSTVPLTAPLTGNAVFDGYINTAVSGKTFDQVGANFSTPTIDCADTVVGPSGFAIVLSWVGLQPHASGTQQLEQTGFEGYCSGPPGKKATGGPFFAAWRLMPSRGRLQHPRQCRGDHRGSQRRSS